MRKLLIVSLTVVAGCTGAEARQATPPLYALMFSTGTGWDTTKPPQDQPGFAAHSRNLRRLREAGIIVAGGRFGDYGLMIVSAPTSDSAKALLAPDSSLAAKTFNVQISRWSTVYAGTLTR